MSRYGLGSRGVAVGLAGLFLIGLLSGLVPLPVKQIENASATSETFYSDGDMDGYIQTMGDPGDPYPPYTWMATDNITSELTCGQFNAFTVYSIVRSYVSFDTSTIPDDAIIHSVTLRLRGSSGVFDANFDVRIWGTSYLSWAADWNATGSLQGTLMNTALFSVGTWYSMFVSSSSLNVTGNTQFLVNSSRDQNTAPPAFATEYFGFNSGNSSYAPELIVFYSIGGTPVSIELDIGAWTTWLNSTAFPEISEWNLTYELYYFAIDTVPLSKNVTITKLNSSWTFKSVAPSCNYTETSTDVLLSDVYDSICYRVWFTVPKSNPYSTIHLSLYNAFTGEGLFWELMRVQMSDGATWDNTTAETVARPDFAVEPDETYTLRVLDYFGNALVDYSFVASTQDVFVSIAVPIYSWQIFNMNDAPVLMQIYWNNSGAPWQFFVGPHWIIERNLKGGDYTFMTTFYNTDGTAGSTVYFNRTVPMTGLNASFVYVNGTTLYEIISTVEGVMATQQIITNLVSPSVVLIYEDLPMAPAKLRTLSLSSSLALDPYLILEATTFQNDTGIAGVNSTLWLPHPSVIGATYYILSDTLSFSGTHATTLYVNQTDETNLLTSATLPATFLLNGENITIWGDVAYSVARATVWREITEYTVNYYSTQKKYETTLALNNSCSLDFYAPYWFIGFPNLTAIDPDSVTLYDLDNGVYLSQRTNFEVSSGGVHLTLVQLNSTSQRNFRLTYFDENSTTGIGAPNLVAESYTQSSLNGIPMKYTAVQWTNPWSVDYRGEIYISLNFSDGDNLLPSSITLIDETTGNVIPPNQYIYTGRTILILTDGVGTVGVGGARNYGIYFTLDAGADVAPHADFLFGPIVFNGQSFLIGGFAVSWFLIIILIAWIAVGLRWWNDKKDWTSLLIMVGAVTIIGYYIAGFMPGG